MRVLSTALLMFATVGAARAHCVTPLPPVVAAPPSRPAPDALAAQTRAFGASAATGVIVGDSIAQAFPTGLLEQALGGTWSSFSNAGDTTQNTLWRLDQLRAGPHPWRLAVLLVGVNNLWRDGACEIAAGVIAVARRLRDLAPQASIGVVSVLPYGPQLAREHAKVLQVNHALAEAARAERYAFIDAHSAFARLCGNQKDPCPLLLDQLHPNTRGYAVLAASIREALRAAPAGARTP